jgi:hypothetical protein
MSETISDSRTFSALQHRARHHFPQESNERDCDADVSNSFICSKFSSYYRILTMVYNFQKY